MMKELKSKNCLSWQLWYGIAYTIMLMDNCFTFKYAMRKGQERHPFLCLPCKNFSSYLFTQKRYSGWPDPAIF